MAAPPARVFAPIRGIGGSTGWYYANWLWHLRGLMDLLFGGQGFHARRRHPEQLEVGDTVDCWQVQAYEENRRLRLAARMLMPGRAWLEFRVTGNGATSLLRQTAIFDPRGLLGRAYWYATYPVHIILFAGMLKEIGRVAVSGPGTHTPTQLS